MNNKLKFIYKKLSLNVPLLLGFIMTSLLILVSIYPEYFSPADPYGVQRLQYDNQGEEAQIIIPPIPPGKDYPWGTDERGRDMKSLIIYGTKMTVVVAFTAAFFRLMIALPLAIAAAYKNKFADWLIRQFKILFSAMPLVVAIIILSRIALFNELIESSALRTAMWVILLGWSPLAVQLKQKVSEVLQQDFVEGEIAIGKTKWEIAIQNVVPHIIPTIIVLFFLEIAMILLLMAQVGVLGVSFGGGYYNEEGGLAIPNEFDWTSLLIFAYVLFGSSKMWMVMYPALAFAFSIISFNLLGEGLRIEFDKRTSRVITYLKKIPSLFSLKDLIFEFKNYNQYKHNIGRKLVVYGVILVILFFPAIPSRYKLNTEEALPIVGELTMEKYQGRHTGSEGMKLAAEFVAGKLQEYGIQPADGKYIHDFKVRETFNVKQASLKVHTEDNQVIEFEHRKDYSVFTPYNAKGKVEILPITPKDLDTLDFEEIKYYQDRMLLLDTRGLDPRILTSTMMRMSFNIKPKAVLLIQGWESTEDYRKYSIIDKTFKDTTVISFSSDKGDELLRHKNLIGELDVQVDAYRDVQGYNVVGIIPGTNPELADQCIVIGSSLDYLGNDTDKSYPGALEAGAVALELQLARNFIDHSIKPEKTILFAFWDGTYTDYRGSAKFVLSTINRKYDKCYYLDLKFLANKNSEKLYIDTTKSIPKSKLSQAYIKTFKATARAKNVPIQYVRMNSLVLQDFLGVGKEALLFTSDGIDDTILTPMDQYENISASKLNEYGQVLFDTIIKISKMKK